MYGVPIIVANIHWRKKHLFHDEIFSPLSILLAYLHGVFLYNNVHEYAWSLLNKPINIFFFFFFYRLEFCDFCWVKDQKDKQCIFIFTAAFAHIYQECQY